MIHLLPRPLQPRWLRDLIDELDQAKRVAAVHAAVEGYWRLRCAQVTNQRNQLATRLARAEELLAVVEPTTTEGDTER